MYYLLLRYICDYTIFFYNIYI